MGTFLSKLVTYSIKIFTQSYLRNVHTSRCMFVSVAEELQPKIQDMGKSKGNEKLNHNQVPGSDGFQRMNFLYQASQIIMDKVPQCAQLTTCYGNQMGPLYQKNNM